MIRHTGGFSCGATSTRSRSNSWARRSASCVDTIPICAPSGPTRRTSGERIRSLMRASIETPHHLREICAGWTVTVGASGKDPDPCSRKYRGWWGWCRYLVRHDPDGGGAHLAFPRGDLVGLLHRPDVRGLLSLRSINDLELHLLALVQGPVSVTLDGREMDEDVVAIGTGDEPVSLLVAEPFDRTLRHLALPWSL